MNPNCLRFLSILILATFILSPGQRLRAGAQRSTDQPTESGMLTGGTTTRVSVSSGGEQGNNVSFDSSISADGRYVAFSSTATNLVDGDTNGLADIFVHDRQMGAIGRVSMSSNGEQADGGSSTTSISGDGRYVAFTSEASNLVGGDTNGWADVFVHDRQTGNTAVVSVPTNGQQGDGGSFWPSISTDGRYVAFTSEATNLVGGDTNGWWDVFVHDRQTGITERVSISSSGEQGDGSSGEPSVSADGRYVAYDSGSSNLGCGDTNYQQIFVHDRTTGITECVSVASISEQGVIDSYSPAISADGRYVAFGSFADFGSGESSFSSDIFLHDRQTGITKLVSLSSNGEPGNNASRMGKSISADGRYIAFYSQASNLVSGDTNDYCPRDDDNSHCIDIFVHDRWTGITERVSISSDGEEGNNESFSPAISGDGRYVAFQSLASNLVSGDTNDAWDVFVHDRGESIERVFLPAVSSDR